MISPQYVFSNEFKSLFSEFFFVIMGALVFSFSEWSILWKKRCYYTWNVMVSCLCVLCEFLYYHFHIYEDIYQTVWYPLNYRFCRVFYYFAGPKGTSGSCTWSFYPTSMFKWNIKLLKRYPCSCHSYRDCLSPIGYALGDQIFKKHK